VERSATSFCRRFEEVAEQHGADGRPDTPVNYATPREISDLADRAPEESLEDALEELAVLQPQIVALQERARAGEATEEDFDVETMNRYAAVARTVMDARHALCS